MECFQKRFPVIQPRRAHHQTALSAHWLLFEGIFRIDFEQQMTEPNRPIDLAPTAVGAIEGHGRLHPLQPLRVDRYLVISIYSVDAAQVFLRAIVVGVFDS